MKALGIAFHREVPRSLRQEPLERWEFTTEILGENNSREPTGGFHSRPGNWAVTKWFLYRESYAIEIFFNYNLAEMQGEFSENDPGYREVLLEVLAIPLRDGPVPERTPRNDPSLTEIGPRFGERKLVARKVSKPAFGPESKRIMFVTHSHTGAATVYTAAPDIPDQHTEIVALQHELQSITPLDSEYKQCLIVETVLKSPGHRSYKDPAVLWWLDRDKPEKRVLTGPWDGKPFELPEKPISADGQFIVIAMLEAEMGETGGVSPIFFVLNRQSGSSQKIVPRFPVTPFLGWARKDEKLRLVLGETHVEEELFKVEFCLIDPETGKSEPITRSAIDWVDKPQSSPRWRAAATSPDGAAIAELEDDTSALHITDLKTKQKRTFKFHKDDQHALEGGAFVWRSPRFIELQLFRLAFLNTETMKMSYPLPRRDESMDHQFNRDFTYVIWQLPDQNLYVSPIILTKQ